LTLPLLYTEGGVVMGTAGYMSPEQVRGQKADSRSDIFAKIERGKGAPTIDTLFLLSERFRKSIDWILRGEGN
jgi:serine/threonine protein kinase